MSKFTLLVALAVPVLAVGLGLGSPSAVAGPGSGGGTPAGSVKIEGSLVAVNPTTGQVSIRTTTGVVTVVANAATKIERNGRRVALSAFRLGDRTQAIATANGVASKIEAVGP